MVVSIPMPLQVDHNWVIPDKYLSLTFVRSSGPGGQNVNKLSTKAELRLKLWECDAISRSQKARLTHRYPGHLTQAGEFILVSDQYRSQRQNEADVRARLRTMLQSVRVAPRPRVATTISLAQKRRRLEQKRQRSHQKRLRSHRSWERD